MAEVRAPLPPPVVPPPPAATPPGERTEGTADAAVPRAGQLSSGWRLIMVVTWVAAVLAWSAVWNASAQLGQPTWWLGTRADPTPLAVRLAPFAGPVVLVIGVLLNARWLAWGGVVAALVFGGYALADFERHADLALVQLGVGVAALAVSLLAVTGTYRRSGPR